MANNDSSNQFGGRIALTIAGVKYVPTEAEIMIIPVNMEVDAEPNQDGSLSFKVKPMPYEADVTFRYDSSIVWQTSMMLSSVDATIVEEDNGRTHLFTSARFVGRPEINLTNGEIKGIKIKSSKYQAV